MEDKILNLKLKYKGRYLDTAKYQRDFHNHLYIGSDKMLLWQILDKRFPEKFQLITRSKGKFFLNLWSEMEILLKIGKNVYSKQQLVEKGVIEDGKIQLQKAQMGRLKFLEDWEIEYNFSQPYQVVLTEKEKQEIRRFATFTPLSPQEKFTRIFLFLGVIFTIGGLWLFEANYEPPALIGLADRLSRIEHIATRVEVEPLREEVRRQPREEVEEEITQQVQQAAQMTSKEFEAEFGLSLTAGLTSGGEGELSSQLLEITEVQEIVAAGEAKGDLPQIRRGSSELDVVSSKIDLSETEGLGDLGSLDGVDLSSDAGFEEIDLANLGGQIGQYNITKIESKKKFEEMKRRFSGIKMMTEEDVEVAELPPQERTELAQIDKVVSAYKPQIIKLFTTESMMIDMYGTLQFNLIISPAGRVEAVDITPFEGSYFTSTFLAKCREIILNWQISVQEAVGYSFRMKFYK